MAKKFTTNEFIDKAKAAHGDLYDYSLVEYVSAHKKVTIIDPEYGPWDQTPSNHLRGQGNPSRSRKTTSGRQTKTTEQFIKDAKEVHGDLYDYSMVKYVHSRERVTIIDPEYGPWEQTPTHHLQGHGNPDRGTQSTATRQTKTTEQFIKDAKEVHGDLYDYSMVKYADSHKKVEIIDPEYGPWEQTPSNHLQGYGNPYRGTQSTATRLTKTTEQFIKNARVIHGDLYDYSAVDYTHAHKKVTIIDPEYGPWEQTPNNHLRGQGNPNRCTRVGTIVYLLEFETGTEHFAKIGILKDSVNKRFGSLTKYITTHFLYDFKWLEDANNIEREILDHVRNQDAMCQAKILKGNGHTETFKVGHIPDVRTMLEQKAQEHKITVDNCSTVL